MEGNSFNSKNMPDWPLDENGEKIAPAFLEHIPGSPLDIEMEVGLLAAYGIPSVCTYPNNGGFSGSSWARRPAERTYSCRKRFWRTLGAS